MGSPTSVKRRRRAARIPNGLGPREIQTARLAYAMGYYESPRQCTMEEIARQLGITKSAVYHRMSKVERRALASLLEGDMPE